MAPKRKAKAPSSSSKKAKAKEEDPTPSKVDVEAPAAPTAASSKKSPAGGKTKPLGSRSVTEVWNSADYVTDGKMTQMGFATFTEHLDITAMSFEAFYLSFRLAPNQVAVDDAMIVCTSKHALQSALDGLGCASPDAQRDFHRPGCVARAHARSRPSPES